MRLGRLRFGFKGMLYDETTGFYNARARWYQPDVGRFMSEDPLGLSAGINQYTFAADDLIDGSDPSGMFAGNDFVCVTFSNGTQACSGSISGVNITARGPDAPSEPADAPSIQGGLLGGVAGGSATMSNTSSAATPKTTPAKRSFLSCTLTVKVAITFGPFGLDAVGAIPGGGNLLHGIQFGAGIIGAGFAVAGDASGAGLSATGVGLALADRTGASTVVHGTEMIPIVGNLISIGATYHDIKGSDGMIARYQSCMARATP